MIIKLGGWKLQIDSADEARVKQHNWHVQVHDTNVYAVRREPCPETGKRKKIYMHRWLLGVTEHEVFVDHINRDGLDNRRENLRETTIQGNNANRTKGAYNRYAKTLRRS